jgi:hypothetical protein
MVTLDASIEKLSLVTGSQEDDCEQYLYHGIAMKTYGKQTLHLIGTLLALCSALRAQENCAGEIKFLLLPPSIQTVITALGFEQKVVGQVYLFDTDDLDLMKQGVILRVRQGRTNDLTVKIRWSVGSEEVATSKLRQRFPCELDRTKEGEDISFSVGRKYKPHQVPEIGKDIARALSRSQKQILQEAGISMDWSRVKRVANIRLTKWESDGALSFRKLALELWESPGENLLEISTKVAPGEGAAKFSELQGLLRQKNLPMAARQGTKTSMVLENLAHPVSPLR